MKGFIIGFDPHPQLIPDGNSQVYKWSAKVKKASFFGEEVSFTMIHEGSEYDVKLKKKEKDLFAGKAHTKDEHEAFCSLKLFVNSTGFSFTGSWTEDEIEYFIMGEVG